MRVRGIDLVQAELPAPGQQATAPPGLGERPVVFRVRQPYCDLKACGSESGRLGFGGSIKFAEGGVSERTAWHPCVESFGRGSAPPG